MSKFQDNRKEIVENILNKIENENLRFQDLWDREAGRPQNPLSGAKYSGGNRLILGYKAVEKEYKDPRWVTFVQAQKEGWKLAKGSKAVTCEKWIFPEEKKEIDENGNTLINLENRKAFPKQFNVFNAEQFENAPQYEYKSLLQKDEAYEIVKDLIKSSEVPVKEIGQDRAYYNGSKDIIVMPLEQHFSKDEAMLSTLLHEMVHSTGHKERLNREQGEKGTNAYAREELVAELGAVFLKQDLGIELKNDLENHSAYLKSYLKVLRDDPNELFRASAEAEKASQRIMGNYNEYLKEKSLEKVETKEITKGSTLEIKEQKKERNPWSKVPKEKDQEKNQVKDQDKKNPWSKKKNDRGMER